ncbi:MAG: DUF4876 domain-containing protein [Muribaculaceae bacterium]|nr:DUF4876 domain-containing protein [Muribaculaceae bacterium]
MRPIKFFFIGCMTAGLLCACSESEVIPTYDVNLRYEMPTDIGSYSVESGILSFTELNSGVFTEIQLADTESARLAPGTYNYEGTMTVMDAGVKRTLRTVGRQVEVTSATSSLDLSWFFYNPDNSLVFSEIFVTGSLNAKGTGGLYDSYFRIYNNTDEVQYADGLAIVESKLTNTDNNTIVTPEAQRNVNFLAQTVYVIPGGGHDVAIQPGQSIKIVDQAINWGEEVSGALDHRDADFEWYDEVTTGSIRDTDNPSVPNLDKWFSYSATIWLPSNQCNRSYALVKFPEGMTAEAFLATYVGDYTYISSVTGKEMVGNKCYRIPHSWIVDGVNLCPTEVYTISALDSSIDMSYKAISEKNSDKNRFGNVFIRRQSGISTTGNVVLMDTDDSAHDFEVKPVR